MRHFISSLFFIFIFNNNCFAQSEKINLSSVINSIILSQNCSYLLNRDEKIYLFSDNRDNNTQEIINYDPYNSHGVQTIYSRDQKKILKKLKKVESGRVLTIENISRSGNELTFNVDLSKIDYQLYKKSQFRVTLANSWLNMHYVQNNGKWTLTAITCNGF